MQRRIGIRCASRGWSVDTTAFRICHSPWAFLSAALSLRRNATDLVVIGLTNFYFITPAVKCPIRGSILRKSRVERRHPHPASAVASRHTRQRLRKNEVCQIVRQLRKEGYYISQPTCRWRAGRPRPAAWLPKDGRGRPSLHRGTRSRLLHAPAHGHVPELLSIEEQGRASFHFARFFNVNCFDRSLS